jgi:hypothetical protein
MEVEMKKILSLCAATLLGGVLMAQTTPSGTVDDMNRNTQRAARDNDYGWIGLFGLAGLAGLMRRNRAETYDARTDVRRSA